MDKKINQILFPLIASAIVGDALDERERALYSPELLEDIYKISKKHDIAHLVGVGLNQSGISKKGDPTFDLISKETITAVYRHEQLNFETESVCKGLEDVGIPFLPLKGAVMRQYYRLPWLRTSCDVDILVKEEDLERASKHLTENCGYTYHGKGQHDVSLYSPSGIHMELHYDLVEEGFAKGASDVLLNVWDYVVPTHPWKYRYEFCDEMFFFYHVAHMAKHFEIGGCGIRPFIDLWILLGIDGADREKRDKLLKKGGLLKFKDTAERLCGIWFEGMPYDPICEKMEEYIISGGVYGTMKNAVTVQQQRRGGKIKYTMSKVFLPYGIIKYHYPILQKHPILTPIMEVRRWFKLLFCGHAGRVARELKQNAEISREEAAEARAFLLSIGL